MELSIWLAFSLACVVIVIVPGPTNLIIMSSALRSTQQAGVCISGTVFAHLMFFALMALGVHVILAQSAFVFEVIRWARGCVLGLAGLGAMAQSGADSGHECCCWSEKSAQSVYGRIPDQCHQSENIAVLWCLFPAVY